MIKILRGSIVDIDVDIIVNPTNEDLVTGGGVDRLISKSIGEPMELAKRAIGKCPTGDVVHTSGFNLKAKHIIHTTAPRFYTLKPYQTPKEDLLASCYRKSLDLARSLGAQSIAVPALGTGAYNWPHDESARIAIDTIRDWKENMAYPLEVYLVLITDEHVERYTNVWSHS